MATGGQDTRRVEFLDDGANGTSSLLVQPQLAHALAIAARLNDGRSKFPIDFASLFIGMLATGGDIGTWMRERLERNDGLQALLLRVGQKDVGQFASTPLDRLGQPLLRTGSTRQALDEGARIADALGTAIDELHVLAAYTTLPRYHESDFREFLIDRAEWARELSQFAARQDPAHAEFWSGFDGRVFPHTQPAPADTASADTASADKTRADTVAVTDAPVDLAALDMEGHVRNALVLAQQIAGDADASAMHVLRAVVTLASPAQSAAFRRIQEILALQATSPATNNTQPATPWRLHAALRAQLAFAARPAANATAPRRLWGRDLVTAALLADDPQLATELEAIGAGLDDVRDRWFRFVTSTDDARTRTEWAEWWRFAGADASRVAPTGIATETDRGVDRLGVVDEANAFARLIMDPAVQPPLSIGLLGDWGSGKSFFMQQIRGQIDALRKSNSPGLCRHVVEIEFNAWHVADANLWASLVTHIFDRIWEQVGNDAQNRDSAQADLRQRIVDARGALHEAEVDAALAGNALATAEAELEQRRKQLAWRTHVTDVVKEQLLAKARALGLGKTLDTIVDIETAIGDLHTAGNRLRLAGTALLERPITNIGVPLAIVLTLVATSWLAMDWLHFDRLVAEYLRWIGAALGVLGALVAPIQLAARKVRAFAGELERTRDEYDHATSEQGGMNASDREAIERARREFSSAEASVTAARDRLARLLEARATADPRRRLGAFLEERVQSTQYRSQQGIISLVHKDFRELAALMRELREHSAEDPAAAPPIRPFDRIVLYVDDLDRCQPAQVVAMLEAVQLLLALDLFVVVVAVDSRWLTRSLEVHYAAFFGDSDGDLRRSTPQNYLEKIFQITYALRAMDPKHFGSYVEALANPGGDPKPKPAVALPINEQVDVSTTGTKPDTQPRRDDESSPSTPDPDDVSVATTATTNTTTTTASTTPGQPTRPLVRAPVRIDASERRYIEGLVALLPTPRIVKRLVNVYRLIKSSKDAEAQAAARTSGADRATLLMLAVLFGRPGVAAELLRELQEGGSDFQNAPQTLCDALDARLQKRIASPVQPESAEKRAAWQEVVALLRTIDPAVTVGACANVVPDVARYSLVTGHEWHTWQARTA